MYQPAPTEPRHTYGNPGFQQAPSDFSSPDPNYYSGRKPDQYEVDKKLLWYKYFLFVFNLIIFLCGAIMLGVGIWMAIDRNFMTEIIGTDLYVVALYFVLISGGLIFFISFLGCCGAITENKCLIYTFMGVLIFLAVILLIGGILAIVFHEQLGDAVKGTMEDTLVNHYGVDFHKQFNRAVTWGWDKTQEKLDCCAVTTEGWSIYQQSRWFDQQPWEPEEQKPYVPQSCCVKDRFWRFVNVDVCQKWRMGPPGSPVDGAINRALYYDGCYDAGLDYLEENSAVLIGLGIAIAVLLIFGIVISFLLVRRISNQDDS